MTYARLNAPLIFSAIELTGFDGRVIGTTCAGLGITRIFETPLSPRPVREAE